MDVKLGNTLSKPWTGIGSNYNNNPPGKSIFEKQALPGKFSLPGCLLEINPKWNFEFLSTRQDSSIQTVDLKDLDKASSAGKEETILGATDPDESFIMDFALQYKEYKDRIMSSSSGEEQKNLLDALALKFNKAVEDAATSLSNSFDKFFNYQKHVYDKYLGSSSEEIFDASQFKDHLMAMAKEALTIAEQAVNRGDAETRITDFLENDKAKDSSLEQMSFHDLKTLTAYFRKLPVLSFSPNTSLEAITGKWLNATNDLFKAKELSLPIQKILNLTVSRNVALFKEEYTYISKDKKYDSELLYFKKKLQAKEDEYNEAKKQSQGYLNLALNQDRIARKLNKLLAQIESWKTIIENTKNVKSENKKVFLHDLKQDSRSDYQQFKKDIEKILVAENSLE
jgi:hypothetical protein